MPHNTTLAVNEIFGPTLQGEGPSVGSPAVFLRLAGCNLSCSWCDTPYSWDFSAESAYSAAQEVSKRPVADVASELLEPLLDTHLLVVTGGEPLLQQEAVLSLLVELDRIAPTADWRAEIETNGTIDPLPVLLGMTRIGFNVSPKQSHAGMDPAQRYNSTALSTWGKASSFVGGGEDVSKVAFKVVCKSAEGVSEAVNLMHEYGVPLSQLMVMPEGRTSEECHVSLLEIVPEAIALGVKVTPRLHLDIWGPERGH
jgi:organic radical activating enzyme